MKIQFKFVYISLILDLSAIHFFTSRRAPLVCGPQWLLSGGGASVVMVLVLCG